MGQRAEQQSKNTRRPDVEAQNWKARWNNAVIIKKGEMPIYKNNPAVAALHASTSAEVEALVLEEHRTLRPENCPRQSPQQATKSNSPVWCGPAHCACKRMGALPQLQRKLWQRGAQRMNCASPSQAYRRWNELARLGLAAE